MGYNTVLIICFVLFWAHTIGDLFSQWVFKPSGNEQILKYFITHTLLYIVPVALTGFIIEISVLWVVVNFFLHLLGDIIVDYRFTKTISPSMTSCIAIKRASATVLILDFIVHYSLLVATYFLIVH